MAFLSVGLLCALISRILLFTAAIKISARWAVGVLLPFGPMFFRIKYPEPARRSLVFRLLTLPCLYLYLVMGPGPTISYYKRRGPKTYPPRKDQVVYYGLEKPPATASKNLATPTPPPPPSLDERRAGNAKEFEHLREWAEELRFRKRDLLHSDQEGNRAYAVDLALYNQALAKANSEKNALAAPGKK